MKLELLIPTSLDEIPLRAYQDFRKTVDGSNDEVFISEKMVSLFCGIELKDIVKIKATDLADMVEHFNRLFAAKTPFKQRFKIGDIEFGFVPNLETISWGEYIDAEKYLSSWENMHKAMAVLYRPITNTKGDKYEIMEYEGTAEFSELMKFTPVSIAMGASVFFWTLGLELLEALAHYLERETKKMSKTTTAKQHTVESNGDGISQSMQQLKETFLSSIESQSSHLLKY
jgi:hypothetical protein